MPKTKQEIAELEKKEETKNKRQLNMARGQGKKEGKKIGFIKGIWMSLGAIAGIVSIGTVSYIIVLAVDTQNIDLKTEIKTTDLGLIIIKKEQTEKGADENQILLAMIEKNKDTIKNPKKYKVSNIKYDKDKLTGEATIYSTNWISKQEVKVTYTVKFATQCTLTSVNKTEEPKKEEPKKEEPKTEEPKKEEPKKEEPKTEEPKKSE